MSSPLVCSLHHHVGSDSEFTTGLNVTTRLEAFSAQLNYLELEYDIVDLETVLSGKLPRRPLLLTFDDAFRSIADVVRDVLRPKRLPSLYFVNPGIVADRVMSLDGCIAWACNCAGLAAVCSEMGWPLHGSVAAAVHSMSAFGSVQRAGYRKQILSRWPAPLEKMSSLLLEQSDFAILKGMGVEIGNHTSSHVHCRALSDAERESEIVGSKTQLEAMGAGHVRSFSVPYGNQADLTPETLQVLRESGHQAIFLVHARANIRRPAPDIWYRVSLRNDPASNLNWVLEKKPVLRRLKAMLRA